MEQDKKDERLNDTEFMEVFCNSRSLMEASKDDRIRDYAEKFVGNLRTSDRVTFDEAYDLAKKLDVAGLWRGNDIAVMFIAKTLKNHNKFKTRCEK